MDYDSDEELKELLLACAEKEKKAASSRPQPSPVPPSHVAPQAAPAAAQEPPKPKRPAGGPTPILESHTSLRLVTRKTASDELERLRAGRRVVGVADLGTMSDSSLEAGDFVLIGVLVVKNMDRTSSSGGKYSTWTLGDLEGHSADIYLFGDAAGQNVPAGMVVSILGPKALPRRGTAAARHFSINNVYQVFEIGHSADYSTCNFQLKHGFTCGRAFNRRKGLFCPEHCRTHNQQQQGAASGDSQRWPLPSSSSKQPQPPKQTDLMRKLAKNHAVHVALRDGPSIYTVQNHLQGLLGNKPPPSSSSSSTLVRRPASSSSSRFQSSLVARPSGAARPQSHPQSHPPPPSMRRTAPSPTLSTTTNRPASTLKPAVATGARPAASRAAPPRAAEAAKQPPPGGGGVRPPASLSSSAVRDKPPPPASSTSPSASASTPAPSSTSTAAAPASQPDPPSTAAPSNCSTSTTASSDAERGQEERRPLHPLQAQPPPRPALPQPGEFMDDEDRRAFSGSVRKPQPSVLFNKGADLNVLQYYQGDADARRQQLKQEAEEVRRAKNEIKKAQIARAFKGAGQRNRHPAQYHSLTGQAPAVSAISAQRQPGPSVLKGSSMVSAALLPPGRPNAAGTTAAASGGGQGSMGMMSEKEMAEVMSRKSRHHDETNEEIKRKLQSVLGRYEEREARTEKLKAVTSTTVDAYHCHECEEYRESWHPICGRDGHTQVKTRATKRFFACNGCGQGVAVVHHPAPRHACTKCGEMSWRKGSMAGSEGKQQGGPLRLVKAIAEWTRPDDYAHLYN